MQPIRSTVAGALLGLAGLMSACSSPPPAPPAKETVAPKAITAEERVKWYQDCWGDFNDKKWDDFVKCYADNATSQQFGYGKTDVSGAAAIVAGSQDFAKSFPDGRGDEQLVLINGTRIASIHLLKGTNTGTLTGPDGKEMPPTKKPFGVLFGHTVEVDATVNKVVTEFGAMDGATFASQLGLSKAPARPAMTALEGPSKVVVAKNDETETKNLELERALFEAWNKHDAAGADAPNADDFVLHDQTIPKDMNRAENVDVNKSFWKGFSDARLSTPTMWAAGDYVAILGRFDGTNDGDVPSMKLKKSGKKASVPFMQIDRLEAGKIKESWVFLDNAAFAAQLAPTPAK